MTDSWLTSPYPDPLLMTQCGELKAPHEEVVICQHCKGICCPEHMLRVGCWVRETVCLRCIKTFRYIDCGHVYTPLRVKHCVVCDRRLCPECVHVIMYQGDHAYACGFHAFDV